MGLTGWAMLDGAGLAAGLLLIASQLLPAAPDLPAALARLAASPSEAAEAGAGGWVQPAGRWLARHTPAAGPLTAPAAELRLLGIDPARFHTLRAAVAVVGLAAPTMLWAAGTVLGLSAPLGLPAVAGLALAAAGWQAATVAVRARAVATRADFRAGLSAYLDLVALQRAAAGSPVQALETVAEIGDSPVFTRIRGRLAHAARTGASPYTALAGLAEELDVAEIKDLADITASAADGAAVYTTLLARSRSLRAAVRADQQAAANAASERLVFPVVLLGVGVLLLLFYPALMRLLTAG
jgi:Type II secretion system (T2SS), protein F